MLRRWAVVYLHGLKTSPAPAGAGLEFDFDDRSFFPQADWHVWLLRIAGQRGAPAA